MKRLFPIGILGGTFDPIHYGHLRLAEEGLNKFKLEKVFFVPLKLPAHKKVYTLKASPEDRAEMIKIAISENPNFYFSDIELNRDNISYTIDTLKHFTQRESGREIVFLLGMDAFMEINTWKDFPSHFDYAKFVVFPRPGFNLKGFNTQEIKGIFKDRKEFTFYRHCIKRGNKKIAIFFNTKTLNISATEIRNMVKKGESIRYLVPEGVYSYIKERRIYEKN